MDLKKLRTIKGMTQLEVAIAVGVSEQTYRQWERGAMKPNEENSKRLDNILNAKNSSGNESYFCMIIDRKSDDTASWLTFSNLTSEQFNCLKEIAKNSGFRFRTLL